MELSLEQKRAIALASARVRAKQAAANAPTHPEFDGSNIPGYDPKTGMVTPQVGALQSAGQGAADATTFGFGDELASYPASWLTGVPRDQVLSEMRGQKQQAAEQNPMSFMAGQVGGGVAQAIAAGPAVFANAPTLLGRVAGGAITGGAMGGAYGLGSGEDMPDRLGQAGTGALWGATIGGAFPLAAAGVSKGYSAVANALLGNRAAKQAGYSPEVLRMMGNALEADGTLGSTGQANIARAGQDAMMADAGPNAKAILDTAIQRGGPGAVTARQAIAARTGRASSAITSALDNTLGAPEGVTAARSAIRTGSAAARGSAYDAAYSAPINYADPKGQAIEAIVKSRVPQSAIAAANDLMRTEGYASQQILAKVADDGTITFERLPDVRQLDYITRGLNEVADQADGAGKLGGTTAKGRAYSNLSGEIRGYLRDLVHEYGTALETAADPIKRSKAVELGSKLLSPSMTRDQVDEAVRGMTGPEKDALAQGVRSRLDDLMANVTRTLQDGDTGAREAVKAIKDLSSRANREKLAAAIGKAKADALFDEIDRAATSFDLRAAVAENSKTYARQATDRRIKEVTSPGVISTAAQGKPINAVQRIAQVLTGQTPANIAKREDAIYSELAKLLTRDPRGMQGLFSVIQGLGQNDQATALTANRIARALNQPQLSYPSSMQLTGN